METVHVAGELVLVIEDNDKSVELVCDVLEVHGFRTLAATTAEQGIALARSRLPDVVLMDIQLPDLDGVSALRRLRTDRHTAALRIIAFTAFAMKEDRARFLAAGFDGYLAKPIDVRTLAAQVHQFCPSAGTRPGHT
jgi:CheY-like chemotaxis protein